jgi:hypothetical protein
MSTTYTRPELREIAKYHKLVLWSVLAAIVYNILSYYFLRIQLVGFLIGLPVVAFQIFSIYKLGTALKLSFVWMLILIIGLFVPFIGILFLLLLCNQANKVLKAANIKVGFMGADPASIRD